MIMINKYHPVLVLETGKDLFNNAVSMHRTFLKFGTYWSIQHCLEGIIEKLKVTDPDILEISRTLAINEDKKFDRIVNN